MYAMIGEIVAKHFLVLIDRLEILFSNLARGSSMRGLSFPHELIHIENDYNG